MFSFYTLSVLGLIWPPDLKCYLGVNSLPELDVVSLAICGALMLNPHQLSTAFPLSQLPKHLTPITIKNYLSSQLSFVNGDSKEKRLSH